MIHRPMYIQSLTPDLIKQVRDDVFHNQLKKRSELHDIYWNKKVNHFNDKRMEQLQQEINDSCEFLQSLDIALRWVIKADQVELTVGDFKVAQSIKEIA